MLFKCLLLLIVTIVTINGQNTVSKTIKKRSIHGKYNRKSKVAIDSAVDDITESTAFADREKKWKALMAGNMYPEHMEIEANKRKEVDNNDEDNVANTPESVGGEKKNRIENHNIEREENLSETLAASDYDDTNNIDDNAENENENESGSGSGESDETTADTKSDEEPEHEESESSTGERRQEKIKCTKKCAMPMTYHECAHPRCSLKFGTIKDLCFFLCKHQKEKCEDVCE